MASIIVLVKPLLKRGGASMAGPADKRGTRCRGNTGGVFFLDGGELMCSFV